MSSRNLCEGNYKYQHTLIFWNLPPRIVVLVKCWLISSFQLKFIDVLYVHILWNKTMSVSDLCEQSAIWDICFERFFISICTLRNQFKLFSIQWNSSTEELTFSYSSFSWFKMTIRSSTYVRIVDLFLLSLRFTKPEQTYDKLSDQIPWTIRGFRFFVIVGMIGLIHVEIFGLQIVHLHLRREECPEIVYMIFHRHYHVRMQQ